jgi:thiamine biosynthesis lipoprotein
MAAPFAFLVPLEPGRELATSAALAEAHGTVAVLERELSEFLPHSPVAALNLAPVGHEIPVPRSVLSLLALSGDLRAATGGAFDAAAKSPGGGGDAFGWSDDRGTAWRIRVDSHLGFGAIGKGFALDRARQVLEREGIRDFCLSAGGSSILLAGFRAPATPWAWGWSWGARIEAEPAGLAFVHHRGDAIALGISGLEEQGPHLIDPRGGHRVTAALSALVAHRSAAEADALSTALFVDGWDRAAAWLKGRGAAAAALIGPGGDTYWNAGFQRYWGPLTPRYAITPGRDTTPASDRGPR